MSLVWNRHKFGHSATGAESNGEYNIELSPDNLWALFDDGRHEGNFATLAAAKKRAAEIEAEWLEAHQ